MGSRSKRQQRQAGRADLARRGQQPQNRPIDPLGIVQQQVTTAWQGPIPSPADLAHYKEVDPSLPNRILTMAERTLELTAAQTSHRVEMERKSIFGMNWRANTGLWLGFIIAMSWFGGSAWLVHDGHEVGGTLLGSVDIVAMVSVFVYGRRDQARQERDRSA